MRTAASTKQFMKELFQETVDDDIFNGAAVLGFYLMLAVFPAMIFVMAVIPYLPIAHVDQAIMDMLQQALPASAADMFTGVVKQVTQEPRGGLLSFGLLAALWATSAGMYAIMQQLNITFGVEEARGFFKARLLAIGLSLLFVVLVLGGFSMIVLGGQIQDWLGARFGLSAGLLDFFIVFRWVVILAGLLLAFALIYYLAPNMKQKFKLITAGSVVGVAVLLVASLAFAEYTQSFANYDATYGSVGAVIVLMMWLYIAGLAILFGSEINALNERHAAGGRQKGERTPSQHSGVSAPHALDTPHVQAAAQAVPAAGMPLHRQSQPDASPRASAAAQPRPRPQSHPPQQQQGSLGRIAAAVLVLTVAALLQRRARKPPPSSSTV